MPGTAHRVPREASVTLQPTAGGPLGSAALAPVLAVGCAALLVWELFWGGRHHPLLVLALAAALAPLALAGLYRPFGAGSLGLGAFVLPVAAIAAGPAICVWLAAAGAFLCSTVRYRLLRPVPAARTPSRDRRGALRRTADALGLAGAAWLAASPLGAAPDSGTARALGLQLASALLFGAGARLVERLPALGRSDAGGESPWPREVLGGAWDALGWALGLSAVRLLDASWASLSTLAIALAALGCVAGIQAARNRELLRSVADLERLVALGSDRPTARRDRLATKIQREIAAVLEFRWIELRLLPAFDPRGVVAARRLQELRDGPARPEPFPRAAAPGIRRRRPWLVIERELRARERALGTVKLWCDPREVAAADLQLLDHLLGQLGGELDRHLLMQEANEDPLTKLARRKVLEERLGRELARCREEGAALALVVLDLDRFKAINDRFGHLAGDRALSHVAAVLLSQLERDQLCCRWGGEEFVVLLPGSTGEEALEVAEQLRRAVAATAVVVEGGVIEPTISAGVAATPELYVVSEVDLFELADRALYAAKAAGRDRCLRTIGPTRYCAIDGTVYGEEAQKKAAPTL